MGENLSSIFEKLNIDKDSISPEMLDNLKGLFNNVSNSSCDCGNDSTNFDIETILKIKNVMDKMNSKNDAPRLKLLNDLKPYLNVAKQNKIDQYMQLDKLLDLLPLLNGNNISLFYSDNQILFLSLIALLF